MIKLTLGFSPCPNDTFIFDALIHGKIDTEGLAFEIIMEDVEALNRRAFEGNIDITKLSYHAFAHLTHQYALLDAGSALGNNCGPLLIAKKSMVRPLRIQYPGACITSPAGEMSKGASSGTTKTGKHSYASSGVQDVDIFAIQTVDPYLNLDFLFSTVYEYQ